MLNSDLSNKHKKFTEPELIIKESSYNYIELSLAEDEGSNLIDSYFIDYKVNIHLSSKMCQEFYIAR